MPRLRGRGRAASGRSGRIGRHGSPTRRRRGRHRRSGATAAQRTARRRGTRAPLLPYAPPSPQAATPDAPFQLPDQYPARRTGRRRGREPPADAARGPDPPPRRRPLHLAADRAAGAAQGRGHRPRGNGPRRRDRTADADGAARGAVAGIRPLGAVRPRAAAPQGPPRAAVLLRPDPRGSHHRHRAPRAEELPPAAGQLLPDPDQVPRRDPPALRRDARARIHDEGRLLLPPRRGLARAGLPGHVRGLLAHLHAHGPALPRRARRHRQHRRQRLAGVPRARGLGRGRHRLLRRATTTPPTSRWPRRWHRPRRAPRPRATTRRRWPRPACAPSRSSRRSWRSRRRSA